jgi:hypothetical protein
VAPEGNAQGGGTTASVGGSTPGMLLSRERPLEYQTQRVLVACLTFPNDYHAPSGSLKTRAVSSVARNIVCKFAVPEVHSGGRIRCFATAPVPMPKTSVHEQRSFIGWKDQIGAARYIASVQSEAIAHRMYESPNDKFRLGVLRTNARHQSRTTLWCKTVNHADIAESNR